MIFAHIGAPRAITVFDRRLALAASTYGPAPLFKRLRGHCVRRRRLINFFFPGPSVSKYQGDPPFWGRDRYRDWISVLATSRMTPGTSGPLNMIRRISALRRSATSFLRIHRVRRSNLLHGRPEDCRMRCITAVYRFIQSTHPRSPAGGENGFAHRRSVRRHSHRQHKNRRRQQRREEQSLEKKKNIGIIAEN